MDETAAPWRALESSPAQPTGPASGGSRSASIARGPVPTLIAIAAAGVLGVVAIWLVVGSSRGSVVVDGDRPAVGASAAAARPGSSATDPALLLVDVQGAVVRPGVVQLAAGSRVGDAIAAAGGYGPRVASDRLAKALNLAALVHDGDQVVVPSRDDPSNVVGGGSTAPTAGGGGGGSGGLVDLNHASAEALDALPGVGPATAAKIIAAREEQPFASVDDLKTRKIVGSATFEKLRALVTVR